MVINFLKNKWRILLYAIFLFLFFVYLLKDNFKAYFWIIDDHEIIINFLPGQKFNFLSFFKETLISDLSNVRFRPAYWFIRSLEFSFFRDKVTLYYLFHFLSIYLSFFFIFLTFVRFFLGNYLMSFFLVILISTQNFFTDIYTRLAPQERYSLLFLSIWLYSFSLTLGKKEVNLKTILIFILSSTFLSLSKENFIIFFPISTAILFYFYLTKKINKKIFIVFFGILTIFILISISVMFFLKGKKLDVYSRPLSFVFRLQILRANLFEILTSLSLNEMLLFSMLIFFGRFHLKKFLLYLFLLSCVITIGFFNYFTNLGQFLAPRYYFPIAVLKYFFYPLVYFLSFNSSKNKRIREINFFILFIFIILALLNSKNITLLKDSVNHNKIRTNQFKKYINNLFEIYNKTNYDFIFVFEPSIIEQLYSINRFLSYKGVKKERYIYMPNSCETYPNNSLEKNLCKFIFDEINGKKREKRKIFFLDYSKLKKENEQCILISNIDSEYLRCKYKFSY